MVSTRWIKIKFSEGERVLCYEPDPSKTKVLYDSKVLEIIPNKDPKGKKQVEYLIHFQGWNASWDRCVSEDLVLKDTVENRELQKELAETAHIKLSIKSNRVLNQGKDKRLSQCSESEKEFKRKCTGSEDGHEDTDSLLSEGEPPAPVNTTTTTNDEECSDEEAYAKNIPFNIPDALKAVLERDFHLINEKNKLLNLPASKTVLSILDDYVRYFAIRYIARSKEKRRAEMKEKEKAFMTLDLCKEIVDSLRVCFDYNIQTLLLYNKEHEQLEKLNKMDSLHKDSFIGVSSNNDFILEDNNQEKYEREKDNPPKRQLRSKRSLTDDSASSETKDLKAASNVTCESGRSTPTTLTSGTSAVATPSEIHNSFLHAESPLHRELKDWTLLPEEQRQPPPPVMKYGAHHLLRLFVKLPQILYKMSLEADKKKYILKHLELFLEYLNSQNQEFFSDANYITNIEN